MTLEEALKIAHEAKLVYQAAMAEVEKLQTKVFNDDEIVYPYIIFLRNNDGKLELQESFTNVIDLMDNYLSGYNTNRYGIAYLKPEAIDSEIIEEFNDRI